METNQNSPHFPQIGEVLRNGHTVDAAYCVGGDRYVLAHRDGAPEPYVVWEVDNDGDTHSGHYFTDKLRAQRHFASCCCEQISISTCDECKNRIVKRFWEEFHRELKTLTAEPTRKA